MIRLLIVLLLGTIAAANVQRGLGLSYLGLEFYRQLENFTLADVDTQCAQDLAQVQLALGNNTNWALKMLDSWGSLPSGVLEGNTRSLGNYDECLRINQQISTDYTLQGKYCFARLPVGQLFQSTSNANIAVCFPTTCDSTDMDILLRQLMEQLGLEVDETAVLVTESTCKTTGREPFDWLTIFTIVLCSVLGLFVLLATLYDYFFCEDPSQLPQLIKAFSARVNSGALFRISNNSNPNMINCLHGLRCMSLIWVIFGHDYIIALKSPNINRMDMFTWGATPFRMFIQQCINAVDTFFFLSGMLVVSSQFRAMERGNGKLNIPKLYLNRYLRLTPVLGFAMLLYVKLLPYFGDGPIWGTTMFDDYSICNKNWYLTLLYVQNFFWDKCISHSWYLAVDMQLYLLSPIFLIALYRWGKKAAAAIVLLILVLSSYLFATMIVNNYSMQIRGDAVKRGEPFIYFPIHVRASTWLVGVLFGYFLYLTKGKRFQLNRLVVWTFWLLSLSFLLVTVMALEPYAGLNATPVPIVNEAFFLSLTRIAWPLALCWVVFACMQGYGGLANSFLASPLWQPLSKLSYCAYIFHIFFENLNSARTHTNTYFSDYDVMLRFWGDFGFTVLLSYVVYILVEAPCSTLVGWWLSDAKKPKPKPAIVPASTEAA
ncbi:nose resistant to fluoxetine protein 6-like [Drosophila nasuta]|uniref:nose resistant to fluoxetine protein 6-like n=1 Tax=Drosophila nasuta TaxID=42062 RepID=UPI00295F0CF4|nr:nose resistant to fluoxetine protein 6-like [Drosophila nasuta]